jgi:hypothetical protein
MNGLKALFFPCCELLDKEAPDRRSITRHLSANWSVPTNARIRSRSAKPMAWSDRACVAQESRPKRP